LLGICHEGVFYIDSKSERAQLIKQFYAMLNNRRNRARLDHVKLVRSGISNERALETTLKPSINRVASKKRDSIKGHKEYHQILSQRDPKKLKRMEEIKQESA